jgi:hypothetical protein
VTFNKLEFKSTVIINLKNQVFFVRDARIRKEMTKGDKRLSFELFTFCNPIYLQSVQVNSAKCVKMDTVACRRVLGSAHL